MGSTTLTFHIAWLSPEGVKANNINKGIITPRWFMGVNPNYKVNA